MRLKFEKRRESGNDVFKIENLSKTFGEKVLFKNFSAEVKKGQKIAIIGANGCGKTTLMEIIASHKLQTSGTILKGVNVDLGYYEQTNRDFMQSETVMDMVWRGDRNLNQTQIRSRCAAMLFSAKTFLKRAICSPAEKEQGVLFARFRLKAQTRCCLMSLQTILIWTRARF